MSAAPPARPSIPPPAVVRPARDSGGSLARRATAAAIDVGLLGAVLVVVLGLLAGFEGATPRSAAAAAGLWVTLDGLALCLALTALVLVATGGHTPGRRMAGLEVASVRPGPLRYGRALLHEAIPRGLALFLVVAPGLDRLAPLVPAVAAVLAIEALLAFAAEPGETVHERLAGSRVRSEPLPAGSAVVRA